MQAEPPCPDLKEWESIVQGPAADVEALARHLEECSRCGATVERLLERDTLVEALRSPAEEMPETAKEAVRRLSAQLRELGQVAADSASQAAAPNTGPAPLAGPTPPPPQKALATPDATQEMYTFLEPPQGPGELGRLGAYRVLKVLGTGGMGVVFLAEDLLLKRPVALKALRPALAADPVARQRFLREAQAMAAVKHDHVVTIYQVGEEAGTPFLAMELLDGETLGQRLRRAGRLTVPEVVRIGRSIAEALAAAHQCGLIHRDIKPANIWLEKLPGEPGASAPGGRVKVLDFGLARGVADDPHLTASGIIVGTPAFMAPEQAQGKSADARSDLFSLGCVLYLLATGRMAFQGPDTLSTLRSLALHEPPPARDVNPNIPLALSELIGRLLAKDPGQRPASARAVVGALEAMQKAPPPEEKELRPSQPSRRLAVLVALAILVVGGVLLAPLVLRIIEKDGKVTDVPIPPGAKVQIVEKSEKENKQGKAPAKDSKVRPSNKRPFLLVRGGSGKRAYKTFADALAELHGGDVIEVHNDGPFRLSQVRLRGKELTLRAASGYRPEFAGLDSKPAGKAGPWFDLDETALTVEGCDFRCPADRTAFRGRGAPWQFHNCRLIGPPDTGPRGWVWPRLLDYSGPRLRIRNCLLAQEHGHTLHLGPETHLELRNNVVTCFLCRLIELDAPGGQTVVLQNNTIAGNGNPLLSFLSVRDKDSDPVTVNAAGNYFNWQGEPLLHFSPEEKDPQAIRVRLRWRGRQNCYHAASPGSLYLKIPPISDLSGWEELWARKEPGSLQTGMRPRWAPLSLPAHFQKQVKPVTDALRRKYGTTLGAFGPDWELLGAGPGYVCALAAAGKAVPPGHQRVKPELGGPFTLLRGDKVVRGYPLLHDALGAAADGDRVEIRTDKPGPGGRVRRPDKGTRRLALRGAPGYHAVITSSLLVDPGNELTVANITFSACGLIGTAPQGGQEARLAGVANCTFAEPAYYHGERLVGLWQGSDGLPAEIRNCLIFTPGWPPPFQARLGPGRKLILRNTVVVGPFRIESLSTKEPVSLDLERCVFWGPWGTPLWTAKGKTSIAARGTLFEGGDCLVGSLGGVLSSWRGSRNVYRVGHQPWIWQHGKLSVGLDAWRRRWNSPENGSVEADPVLYEPRQWQFLSANSDDVSPEGKKFGADVSRVATGAPRSKGPR